METQESAHWDLAVLQCNERKSGQAPIASVVFETAGQSEGEGEEGENRDGLNTNILSRPNLSTLGGNFQSKQ